MDKAVRAVTTEYIAMVVSGHWFKQPPQGVKVDSHVLLKSSVFEPRDLDMLSLRTLFTARLAGELPDK